MSSKLKEIWRAYTNPIPEDQPHYKYRMSVCGGCEHNTDNLRPSEYSTKTKSLNVVQGKQSRCNACGCPLSAKCGSKLSYCGVKDKIYKGQMQKAKWTPVELEMQRQFRVLNLAPETTDTEKVDKNTIKVNVRELDGDLAKVRLQLTDTWDGCRVTVLKNDGWRSLVIASKNQETEYDCSLEVSIRTTDLVEGLNRIEYGIMYQNTKNTTRRLNVIMTIDYDKQG